MFPVLVFGGIICQNRQPFGVLGAFAMRRQHGEQLTRRRLRDVHEARQQRAHRAAGNTFVWFPRACYAICGVRLFEHLQLNDGIGIIETGQFLEDARNEGRIVGRENANMIAGFVLDL